LGRRTRRLLYDRRRSRAARGPAQGPRGLADPIGQLGGGVWPAPAGDAVRRRPLRAPRAWGAAAAVPAGGASSGRVRPPARRRRLLPRAGQGGRDRRSFVRGRSAAARGPRRLPPPPRARHRRWRWGGERRRAVHRRPPARGSRAGRWPCGRVRVRTVRLPGPGHEPPGARGGTVNRLEHGEVALELPGGHLDPVVLPLLALDLDVAVEHVLTE